MGVLGVRLVVAVSGVTSRAIAWLWGSARGTRLFWALGLAQEERAGQAEDAGVRAQRVWVLPARSPILLLPSGGYPQPPSPFPHCWSVGGFLAHQMFAGACVIPVCAA